MRATRFLAITVVATAAVGLFSAPAAAEPPQEFSIRYSYDAGDRCTFPLQVDYSGKGKALERDDVTILTGPRNVAVLTNLATGTSITVTIGGIFKDTAGAGPGGTTATVSTGRNVVLSTNASVLLLQGRYTFALNGDNAFVAGPRGSGRIIDLCAAIA